MFTGIGGIGEQNGEYENKATRNFQLVVFLDNF